ncbi:phospholipase D-like domain-containing protein [Cupriavidus basilensis]
MFARLAGKAAGSAASSAGSWARRLRRALVCALVLFAESCASLPPSVPREQTAALSDPATTALGRLVVESSPDPALSGFHVIASGEEAYGTLISLANHATRTLDLQYYIIEADESSREILHQVRAAAERGVRVRVLVDDLHSDGEDRAFLRFAGHRNIEVRMFNPFPAGRFSKFTRMLSSATDVRRLNRRMHNKAFIADNALAMTGGRNIGNAYFLRAPDTNFVDLDVIAAGPAVRRLSAAFDQYWNNPLAVSVETLATPAETADAAASAGGAQRGTARADPGRRGNRAQAHRGTGHDAARHNRRTRQLPRAPVHGRWQAGARMGIRQRDGGCAEQGVAGPGARRRRDHG